MSGADLQELEEVKGLIARELQVGVLTYAEIATATAEFGLEESDVEELHGVFERCEIELIEEIDPATAASLTIERQQPIGLRIPIINADNLSPSSCMSHRHTYGSFGKRMGRSHFTLIKDDTFVSKQTLIATITIPTIPCCHGSTSSLQVLEPSCMVQLLFKGDACAQFSMEWPMPE